MIFTATILDEPLVTIQMKLNPKIACILKLDGLAKTKFLLGKILVQTRT